MRFTLLCLSITVGITSASVSTLAQEPPADEYLPLPEYAEFGAPASDADKREIAELMQRFREAWGSEDVDGLLGTYAEDAEWINAYGVVLRGREDMRRFFTMLFERFDNAVAADEMEKRERISARYVGDDAAVLHTYTESQRTENRDGMGARRVQVTYVLEKRADGWKIVHQMIMDVRL